MSVLHLGSHQVPKLLCVCTRVYKHTPTHHPNSRKNREIHKTKPLHLPPPKHSLPHQQQALTMNTLKTPHLQSSHTHACRCSEIPVIHTHVVKRLESTNKQNAPTHTSAYVHPQASVCKCICIHIHRHTYIHIHTYTHAHIHAYMHTHLQMHAYAHLCTIRKSQWRRLNVSREENVTAPVHVLCRAKM